MRKSGQDRLRDYKASAAYRRYLETKHNMRLRAAALLGGKCSACHIDDWRVLHIDHPKGGGAEDQVGGAPVLRESVCFSS